MTVELPQDFPIVERDAVRLVIRDCEDRILLFHTHEITAPELGQWWELPGGGIDEGETYPCDGRCCPLARDQAAIASRAAMARKAQVRIVRFGIALPAGNEPKPPRREVQLINDAAVRLRRQGLQG